MKRMFDNKWYRFLIWALTILVTILVGSRVAFVFQPVQVIFTLTALPLIISGLLFYFTLGIVNWLEEKTKRRSIAVAITFLGLFAIIAAAFGVLGPILIHQVTSLVASIPNIIADFQTQLVEVRQQFANNEYLARFLQENDDMFVDFTKNITTYLGDLFSNVATSVGDFIGVLASAVITALVIPFMLIYMLLDGHKFPDAIVRMLPRSYEKETRTILHDMHITVRNYVNAQLVVAFFIGVFSFVGLVIVDVDYAVLLALFMMVTNIIPYLGPFLGAVPAVIVAFIDDPIKVLWVAIVILIVQQIESNIISPLIQGKSLKVHPLTIIIVLLVAGNLAGIVGMLIAVPFYAVAKVVVLNAVRIYRLREQALEESTHTDSPASTDE